MTTDMDLVFCGTPQFAVPALQALADAGHRVRLVVTQPDRPSGRGMELAVPPVKQLAQQLGLEVTQPEKIKNNLEFRARLEEIRPEAIVVVGYGRIIPQWMIDLPPLGNINLHGSLLPKYRGAAPVQWAIAMGETVTGVTTMRIDAGLDTGDMLLQRETPITAEDTAVTLAHRLAEMGAPLMVETLAGLKAGTITPRQQDDAQATLAPILKKEDGLIDFRRSARQICNRLRGFQPWPGAYTTFRGKNLNLLAAREQEAGAKGQESGRPGEMNVEKDRLFVLCGERTVLELLTVQPEGKKQMAARDFVHGYHPKSGEQMGTEDHRDTEAQR
jgi:methionyl-tRNA formyltransferase